MLTALIGVAIGAAFLAALLGTEKVHREANPPKPPRPLFRVQMEDGKEGDVYPPKPPQKD